MGSTCGSGTARTVWSKVFLSFEGLVLRAALSGVGIRVTDVTPVVRARAVAAGAVVGRDVGAPLGGVPTNSHRIWPPSREGWMREEDDEHRGADPPHVPGFCSPHARSGALSAQVLGGLCWCHRPRSGSATTRRHPRLPELFGSGTEDPRSDGGRGISCRTARARRWHASGKTA